LFASGFTVLVGIDDAHVVPKEKDQPLSGLDNEVENNLDDHFTKFEIS
jgi:hypothetical protein